MGEINSIRNRNDALMILGLPLQADEEDIKRRYKQLSKKYHPDQNKQPYAQSYYIQVQQAYQYLKEHPYAEYYTAQNARIYGNQSATTMMNYTMYPNQFFQGYNVNAGQYGYKRPAKIFATDKHAAKMRERQRAYAEDKKRAENSLKEKEADSKESETSSKDKASEALKAIQAIWLAEQIRRRIAQDKLEKEKEQRRNLYKAFSQHELHAKEENTFYNEEI